MVSGSTATTLALPSVAAATPAISPPPPTATTTVSSSPPVCSSNSSPSVPWPAQTSGWSYGWQNSAPTSAACLTASS